ncbi:MAG: ThuA domain-containing protein [Pirellulaceae bacterium]|nr:ThuA domain-containing protein [Pirellulaceae bacterium]
MKTRILTLLAVLSLVVSPALGQQKLKALIIDGQNNHAAWPKTTMMMKRYLEASGLYEVDIARTKFTWNGDEYLPKYPLNDGVLRTHLKKAQADPDFKPNFDQYKVVISNFGNAAEPWPDETKVAFEKYVAGGGGLVVVHAADNAFGDWDAYNRMIGLGGWGGRNEKSGFNIFLDSDGKTVKDDGPGKSGSHGSQHEFEVVIRDAEHPITKGIPRSFLHTQDELYDRLRGPGEGMKILATAYSSPDHKGSGRHEPMLMTIDYGKGRVFHNPMGHADYSMECVGFITLFLRGTEWAATGKVTQTEVPADFPTADKSSKRSFE